MVIKGDINEANTFGEVVWTGDYKIGGINQWKMWHEYVLFRGHIFKKYEIKEMTCWNWNWVYENMFLVRGEKS